MRFRRFRCFLLSPLIFLRHYAAIFDIFFHFIISLLADFRICRFRCFRLSLIAAVSFIFAADDIFASPRLSAFSRHRQLKITLSAFAAISMMPPPLIPYALSLRLFSCLALLSLMLSPRRCIDISMIIFSPLRLPPLFSFSLMPLLRCPPPPRPPPDSRRADIFAAARCRRAADAYGARERASLLSDRCTMRSDAAVRAERRRRRRFYAAA